MDSEAIGDKPRAGADTIDPVTWSGSLPQARGVAPRVRIGRSRWFNLLWLLPVAGLARADGLPAWVGAQHFLTCSS